MKSREEIAFLNQLVLSVEEAKLKLEEDYRQRDADGFNRAKKFIIQTRKKILEVLNGL